MNDQELQEVATTVLALYAEAERLREEGEALSCAVACFWDDGDEDALWDAHCEFREAQTFISTWDFGFWADRDAYLARLLASPGAEKMALKIATSPDWELTPIEQAALYVAEWKRVITFSDASADPESAETKPVRRTLTMQEACRVLGIPRSSGYDLANSDRFPCRVIRAGGRWYVPIDAEERRMTERMQANALKRLFAVLVEIAEANQKESEETMSVPDETEIKPRFAETYSHVAPRCYMRINVTKNTKGYSYETTVSVESDDPVATGDLVKEMLIDADLIAHDEIERRETENSGEL